MTTAQAIFALIGVVLLFVAAIARPASPWPVSVALLGAAFLALAYELPVIHAGL